MGEDTQLATSSLDQWRIFPAMRNKDFHLEAQESDTMISPTTKSLSSDMAFKIREVLANVEVGQAIRRRLQLKHLVLHLSHHFYQMEWQCSIQTPSHLTRVLSNLNR